MQNIRATEDGVLKRISCKNEFTSKCGNLYSADTTQRIIQLTQLKGAIIEMLNVRTTFDKIWQMLFLGSSFFFTLTLQRYK